MDFNVELRKNHYYTGKKITKEDLSLEQDYLVDKIKTINKMLVGYGIVSGLSIDSFKNENKTITINKGLGIDSHGNFLSLLAKKVFSLPRKLENGDYIYLKFSPTSEDRKPIANEDACDEDCTFNHIVDDMQIYLSKNYEVINVRNICVENQAPRKDNEIKEPTLYIGQYKVNGSKTLIKPDKRLYVYTNDELFKLLCKINKSYVSSVNEQTGDLNLISSIGDAKPNKDGEIELEVGNSLSLAYDDNKITINSKSGFYKEYNFSLEKGKSQRINHLLNRFPIVEVYERQLDLPDDVPNQPPRRDNTWPPIKHMDVYYESELRAMARDLEKDFEEYRVEESIIPFSKKAGSLNNKKYTVKSALNKEGILGNASDKVLKLSDKKLHYYTDKLFLIPKYKYRKIIGADTANDLRFGVTHTSRYTTEIKNLSGKKVDILVVLNT